jgi:SH3-like domain-containing protein
MRPMYIIGGAIVALALIGVLVWTRIAPAQAPPVPVTSTPETLTVVVPEVDVRSGPSAEFYATSKLKQGDHVEVVGKSDKNPGWLAIKPPSGSSSWINSRFVQINSKTQGVVICAEGTEVPVKPASSVTKQEPNVEIVKVSRGTQLTILGDPVYNGPNGAWLPIAPTATEVRYIPESAVSKNVIQQVGASSTGNGFVVPPGGDQSLIARADALLLECRQTLEKAAQSSDPAQQAQARSRLASLPQFGTGGVAIPPASPYSTAAQGGAPPKVVLGSTVSGQGTTTAAYSLSSQQGPVGAAKWSIWGTLRPTAYKQPDGQPLYKIVDERGTPKEYAVAAAGLTLEPYVGQTVCVYGAPTYRSDDYLRVNYTIVSHVALPPGK